MVDVIRSIERHTTAAEWAVYMSAEKQTWIFSGQPSRLKPCSVMFFALHGLIQGVGRCVSITDKKNRNGYYLVTTDRNQPLIDFDLEFRGYAQLRYLDELVDQYDGKYFGLVKRLTKYAQQFRNGTLKKDYR